MGRLLHGTFKLKIVSIRNVGYGDTDRYNAIIISTGENVSVKFKNMDKDLNLFVGKIGVFDGDNNDIQTDPKHRIDLSRPRESFDNPFITYTGE
jgi:hypothetical protein